jgi:hypothetical protein
MTESVERELMELDRAIRAADEKSGSDQLCAL